MIDKKKLICISWDFVLNKFFEFKKYSIITGVKKPCLCLMCVSLVDYLLCRI